MFDGHVSYVAATLGRLGVDERDRDDLVSEVFVRVHRALASYDAARPMKPWLFAFAARVASEHRRLARHRREVFAEVDMASSELAADETIERRQARQMLERALGELDEEKREVFVLHDLDETPVPEVASKAFCTHGTVGEIAVVLAISDPDGRKGRNVSAFVLEKGMPGFRAGKKENKLGIRASDTAELVLEECFVPDSHLLGNPGEGFRQALAVLDGGRISIAALGLGTAIGAYETALAYAKQREQFGQPIAEFQAIRFALAEMATRIAAAEALTFAAATEMDNTGKVTLKASEAKLMTGEAAVFCSERGVQIHGGYGFIKDYRAEKYYRDAKICTIGEGTSEVQRLVIARELLQA